jgi:hypothetical protein
VAVLLLFVAASLGTTLKAYRRRRQRARDSERALGRTVIVEIPGAGDLVLFSEDHARFYYGDRSIDKDLIVAARILINGSPIAEAGRRSSGRAGKAGPGGAAGPNAQAIDASEAGSGGATADTTGGIIRDRWDVEVESLNETTLIECGAIRERVSQELARAVFEAVKHELERQDAGHHSISDTPAR